MIAAADWPRDRAQDTRVLRVRGELAPRAGTSVDFERWIEARSVLVLNDAATIPASLTGTTRDGAAIEARLVEMVEPSIAHPRSTAPRDVTVDADSVDLPAQRRASASGMLSNNAGFVARAVLFGAGDWRTPTEHRGRAPSVARGEVIELGPLRAEVEHVDESHPRLVRLRFLSENLQAILAGLYAHGRPVQYSYVREALALWNVQTPLATRPAAVETPSSAYSLSWAILGRLRAKGVKIATVTHGTGLSSTGDDALDREFPLDERYEIGARAAALINEASERGRAVIVVGTGAMRAIESSARANGGRVAAGVARTALRLGPSERAIVTTGIITGLHEPGTSHGSLLESLVNRAAIERASRAAEREGLRAHEFGDAMLVERV